MTRDLILQFLAQGDSPGDVDLDDLNPESLWKFRVKGFGPLLPGVFHFFPPSSER